MDPTKRVSWRDDLFDLIDALQAQAKPTMRDAAYYKRIAEELQNTYDRLDQIDPGICRE